MKHLTLKSLSLVAVLVGMVSRAEADVILFQEKFEGTNLNQWIGKSGVPHNGQIVTDPLNPTNHVLAFTGVNFSGDIFSAAPVNLSRPRRYVLKFDFLGRPGLVENGGFIGIASAPTSESQQFWIGGTYAGALTAPPGIATTLVVDGAWHHYEIDFTDLVTAYGLTQTLLMLEDWGNFGSVPGDAYFDNISVVGVYDINTVLAQVPCEGPAPGKKWKNHGQYVSTVSAVADLYLSANIIAPEEVKQITAIAGQSDCGNKK